MPGILNTTFAVFSAIRAEAAYDSKQGVYLGALTTFL